MYPQVDPSQVEQVEQVNPVVFVDVPQPKPVTALGLQRVEAETAAKAAPIKVRVNKPYRVIHKGMAFVGGQTLSVPNDETHSRWLDAGWVSKVKGK